MTDYSLPFGVHLYFTGTFGNREVTEDSFRNLVTQITTTPIKTIEELWRVVDNIPSFLDANDGFTYYWFKEGKSVIWESEDNSNGAVCSYSHEEDEQLIKSNPLHWAQVKADLEGRALALLSLFVGGSLPAFTDLVNGLLFKVRRTRISYELWLHKEPSPDEKKLLDQCLSAALQIDSAKTRHIHLKNTRDLISRSQTSSRRSSRAPSEDRSRMHKRSR